MSGTATRGMALKRWMVVGPALLALLAGSLTLWFAPHPHQVSVGRSLFTVTILLAVIIGLLEVIARSNPNAERKRLGFLEVVLGADGRISTSKTVVAVWTLVFALALMLLTGLVWFGGLSAAASFGGNWDAYLILLGGPFASAVIAKGIVVGQLSTSPDAKSSTTAQSGAAMPSTVTTTKPPGAADMVTDDAGDTDLVDTQYLLFSVVAVAYFVGTLATLVVRYAQGAAVATVALPRIPSALLALTSASALTYVGNKAVQTRGLRTISMTPNPVAPGGDVTAELVNLPKGATKDNTVVMIRGDALPPDTEAPEDIDVGAGKLVFRAPAAEGPYQISISVPDSTAGPLPLQVKSP